MNKRPVMWSIVTAALVLVMSLGETPPAASADDMPRQQAAVVDPKVDGFVRSRLEALGIPGAAVAVVKDGKTLHLAGYGDADPEGPGSSNMRASGRENGHDECHGQVVMSV